MAIDFKADRRFVSKDKVINGTAYLIAGSKKATLAVIDGVCGAIPAGPARDAARRQMKDALIKPFEITRKVWYVRDELREDIGAVFALYGKSDDEADNIRKALAYVASKAETNQMDVERSDESSRILEANASVMANAMSVLSPTAQKNINATTEDDDADAVNE